MAMSKWTKIRNEYINGDMSLRALALKHNVSRQQISNRCKAENWVEARKEQRAKIQTKLGQKTAEKIAEQESDIVARIARVNQRLISNIEKACDELDVTIVKKRTQRKEGTTAGVKGGQYEETLVVSEELEASRSVVDTARIKQITSALKDIAEVYKITSSNTVAESEDSDIVKALREAFKGGVELDRSISETTSDN